MKGVPHGWQFGAPFGSVVIRAEAATDVILVIALACSVLALALQILAVVWTI